MINGNFCFALLKLQSLERQINVCFVLCTQNVECYLFVGSAIKHLKNDVVKVSQCASYSTRNIHGNLFKNKTVMQYFAVRKKNTNVSKVTSQKNIIAQQT